MKPAVSVVLPAWNAGATIVRAIESVRAQSFADWELVVVDDGSTDATPRIVAEAARRDPRIRLLEQPHAGIVGALNAGLAASHSDLVARLDADDAAHPERLAEQVAFLAAPEHRDIGLVGCLIEFGGHRAASEGYALHVDWLNSLIAPDEIARRRFVESPFAHPSVMFRRELVTRHGAYRAGDFPEDYELWLRWLDAGVRMAKVPRVLLTWNDPAGRLSRTDARYAPEAFFRLKARWLARWLRRERVSGAKDLLVWGAGRPTRKRAAHLEAEGVGIAGYVDVDPAKLTPAIGGRGRPVVSPGALPPPGRAFVLAYVGSRGARELIARELLARGYAEGRDFLLCA